ncbi:MAG: excalibur calcium-binding domain-containing protein [Rhodobiaceae bacterium]|nr:excalibur calcium-binding domain-containing protein [Rhodobiaceae bacterium]
MQLSSSDANEKAGRKTASAQEKLMQQFRGGSPAAAAADAPMSEPRRDWTFAVIMFVALAAIPAGTLIGSPWPIPVLLKHLASMPNCQSAAFFGLAPAERSKPGYWFWLDRDDDGIACEPWEAR